MKFNRSFWTFTALAAVLVVGLLAIGSTFGVKCAVVAYLGANALCSPLMSFSLGAHTSIADLWTPAVWIPGIAERLTTRKSLINSGICVRNPYTAEAVAGPGTKVEVPFIREVHVDDAPQQENNDVTVSSLASGKQTIAILNRRWAVGATALSKAVSGADPLGSAFNFMADNRLRQRQKTLLSILRGVFGNAAAPGAGAAAFKAMRRDIFLEAGAAPAAGQLFSSDEYIKSLGLMGEVKDMLDGCVIVCHSAIEQAMLLQDDITVVRDSEGKPRIQTYKNAPVFVSDLLYRAGATSGMVYDTYIFAPGAVAYDEAPQTSNVGDVASLVKIEDGKQNNVAFADYTRFCMHPQGASWAGAPAGQSATNAELATEGNWTLALNDIKNARIVCLRTNG